MNNTHILLIVPSHDGKPVIGCVKSLLNAVLFVEEDKERPPYLIDYAFIKGSEISHAFNLAVMFAKKQGCTHLLLLHDDMEVLEKDWVKQLLNVMRESKAVMVGAINSMKSPERKTSTVLRDVHGMFTFKNMTLEEAQKQAGERGWFVADCVNTGVTLFDLTSNVLSTPFQYNTSPTALHRSYFEVMHEVDPLTGNCFFIPEDYNISRAIRARGGTCVATTLVTTRHWGDIAWTNNP